MHWVNVVWIVAASISGAAITLFAFALGFGWYGVIAGPPVFVIVSVLLPFFLGIADRKREVTAKRDARKPKRPLTRQPIAKPTKKPAHKPTPAVAPAMKASSAESAGRTPMEHCPLPPRGRGRNRAPRDSAENSARV